MGFLIQLRVLLWKDLLSELRGKELISMMAFFGLLVLVIFNFAFEPGSAEAAHLGSGILWVAFTFAGVLGLNRSFLLEKESEGLQGLLLSPVDRGVLYLGKLGGNFLFMLLVEALILPFFALFFNLDLWLLLPQLALVAILSTLGFTAVGTLFAAMSAQAKSRELLLPTLLLPIVVPVIVAAVKSTGQILEGRPLAEVAQWLKLLLAFDLLYLVVSFLIFEYVVEE
ncbi:MAG: heme exporter protein CcmB [Nitrospinae bacterium]|nr:heme exporter protein CcmB [Nitrospinota bacterium]